MNPIVLKWLLAMSLAVNVGTVVAVLVAKGAAQPEAVAPQLDLPDYLALGREQRQRWGQLEPAFLRDIESNWRAIRHHRESLVRQVLSAAPDQGAIDAEQASIARLQDAQQRRVIVQLLAERELLDAAQREKLMTLLLGRYAQEETEEQRLHGAGKK